MRHFISLLAVGSGLALATTVMGSFQAVTATENKAETHIASLALESQNLSANQTKVVCSRNQPLAMNNTEGSVKVASGIVSQSTGWAPNIIKLFCRDVRINTIVVRDYCALIRQ
jgi:hypothetical protein